MKVQRQINGRRITFSTNGAITIGHPCTENKQKSTLKMSTNTYINNLPHKK